MIEGFGNLGLTWFTYVFGQWVMRGAADYQQFTLMKVPG